MRCVLLGWLVLAACEDEGVYLPPPPEEAVTSCHLERITSTGKRSESTIWFDVSGRAIRADSDVDGATHIAHDDEGRLTELRAAEGTHTISYEADRITSVTTWKGTGESSNTFTYVDTLVDGQIVMSVGPIENEAGYRSELAYTYDAMGLVASRRGTSRSDGEVRRYDLEYAHDIEGRLTSIKSGDDSLEVFDYTTTETSLEGANARRGHRWTFDLDTSQRLIRSAVRFGDDYEYTVMYTYADGLIEATDGSSVVRATGTCEPPAIVTTLPQPLPFRWSAPIISIPNPAATILTTVGFF